MTYDDFTIKAQEAILQAQRIAAGFEQQTVDTVHLIKGILETNEDIAKFILQKAGVGLELLERELSRELQGYARVTGIEKQYLTNDANAALNRSKRALKEFGDEYISVELILLGIVAGNDKGARILRELGASFETVRDAIKELRKGNKITDKSGDSQYNALKKFAINLNERAESGKLDPIVGRDDEIRRILHILSRRKKNNPILVGDAGVGKTAIVEGIAWRIINKDVPDNLLSKQIYVLDLAALIAGAKYKGEFEERLKGVIKEVQSSSGEIILFIDEIHTLIGAGGGSGAMDAANILKPALARGELRTIGATTPDEYQKYFEQDKALVRRFQTVFIDEPSVEDTISILRGIQEKYEVYHKVELLDEALVAAAELSHRYIADRHLPDKAIDLIDEAAARLRLELDSVPEEIDELKRRVRQLEIEREHIKREGDARKLATINEQIANSRERLDGIKAAWQNEKEIIETIQTIKEHIEQLQIESDSAERASDFEKVARIRYGELQEQKTMLTVVEEKLDALPPEKRYTKEEVTANDIAAVVSRWTGIPLSKMMQSEKDKLLNLEHEIHKRLIGQEEAVGAVSDAIRRAHAGLQNPNRPIGSFIFLGPTGVGKTELGKALAEVLFDTEQAIIRIDMSEYQERHSVSRLVGAPPGYVGYDEGGQLTEAVRRRPYSIILLDEIEKAHPDTYNVLLQVLDDGRLTDNKGRVANFRNTIIIMTSNLASDVILENFADLDALGDKHREEIIKTTKEEVFNRLKEHMQPEFINRIDDRIMFAPLTKSEIRQIAMLQIDKVRRNLARREFGLEISDRALDLLADLGYDPQFGARPLQRVIQREIVNELSKQVLSGEFEPGETIYIDSAGDKFVFDEEGFAGSPDVVLPLEPADASPADGDSGSGGTRRSRRRKRDLDELMQATKEVEDAVKEVKGEEEKE